MGFTLNEIWFYHFFDPFKSLIRFAPPRFIITPGISPWPEWYMHATTTDRRSRIFGLVYCISLCTHIEYRVEYVCVFKRATCVLPPLCKGFLETRKIWKEEWVVIDTDYWHCLFCKQYSLLSSFLNVGSHCWFYCIHYWFLVLSLYCQRWAA